MTALITVGALIDEPSRRVDYFGITSKGIDEWFHLAEPATADTVINHNVIEDISSAETILSEAVKVQKSQRSTTGQQRCERLPCRAGQDECYLN